MAQQDRFDWNQIMNAMAGQAGAAGAGAPAGSSSPAGAAIPAQSAGVAEGTDKAATYLPMTEASANASTATAKPALNNTATGAAVGGPWGAAVGALADLLFYSMNKKEQARKENLVRRQELENAKVKSIGTSADREQAGINQLLGVLARTVR